MDTEPPEQSDENGIWKQNPLLIENIMQEVFSYFETDAWNLRRFRLVCQAWNLAATPVVRRSLQWKIGPNDSGRGIREFMECMSNSKGNLFRSFQLTNSILPSPKPLQYNNGKDKKEHVQEELEEYEDEGVEASFVALFGPQIIELRIEAEDYTVYKWGSDLSQLGVHNLEHLELYVRSRARTDPWDSLFKRDKLPKLKSLVLRFVDEGPQLPDCMLDNLPNLDRLEIYGRHRLLRGLEGANLSSLTCLKIHPASCADDPAPTGEVSFLTQDDLDIIEKQCMNVKILWLSVIFADIESDDEVGENVGTLVQELAPNLEELQIVNVGPRRRSDGNPTNGTLNEIFLPRLKTLRVRNWDLLLRNFDMPVLSVLDIERIISAEIPRFPSSITHLEIILEFEPDEVLRQIFQQLPQLKRLHLGRSKITDSGITGISPEDLKRLPSFACTNVTKLDEDANSLRNNLFIGDLKYLQHFTFTGRSLSNKSIYSGFKHLKELTYFKVPPFFDSGPGYVSIEAVDARVLVDSCPALVRIDVNGFPDETNDEEDDDLDEYYNYGGTMWQRSKSDPPPPPGFCRGCGLRDDEIKYIRTKSPYLEIVHRERYSVSQQERLARRGHSPVRHGHAPQTSK